MEAKGVKEVVLLPERYNELLNIEEAVREPYLEEQRRLNGVIDGLLDDVSKLSENYTIIQFDRTYPIHKKDDFGMQIRIPRDVRVLADTALDNELTRRQTEIERLRGDWKLIHDDLLDLQKENAALKWDKPHSWDKFFKINIWFWILMGYAAMAIISQF